MRRDRSVFVEEAQLAGNALQRGRDVHESSLEVDVAPSQAKHLSPSEPRCCGNRNWHVELRSLGSTENSGESAGVWD